MKKSDIIYKKIENFLLARGCRPWKHLKTSFIAPNGHRFSFETTSEIISIFHRDSEWGRKSNCFVRMSENLALETALCFIDRKLREKDS